MAEEVFRFKRFSVSHGKSSMKVGVDAVLLGAWAQSNGRSILDVGTGCGVIALILAQKLPDAEIDAIDIDPGSISEAEENFNNSIWSSRLHSNLISWEEKLRVHNTKDIIDEVVPKYDLIISNPPYFDSGISNPTTSRERARHQSSLSVFTLIRESQQLLNKNGALAMIFPMEFRDRAVEMAKDEGMSVRRECRIRNNPTRPYKRVMLEFQRDNDLIKESSPELLTLFENGVPTSEYRQLCKDLYLKF